MTSSLHTKYRPRTFGEVIGHPSVIGSLRKAVSAKRAHTFCFTGPPGTGKTTLARILANEFCDRKATSLNIEEVSAADHTGVDAMRVLANKALLRAMGASPVRVFILDEAHRLSGAAWDAILKPIEEPPPYVYWMICTTNPGKIPKTIMTRCLTYALNPVKEDLLLELLVQVCDAEGLATPDEVLEVLAETAQGSPRQALVGLEACAYAETGAEARAYMRSAGQSKEVVDLCRWLVGGRGHSWPEAIKFVKALEATDAESIRIVVCNYVSSVLMNTKKGEQAAKLLGILECFATPYNTSDKMAPLLMSLGMAIGLDQ